MKPGVRELIVKQAAISQATAAVHDEDHIFNFVINHGGFPSDESRVRYYFEDGARSAAKFHDLVCQYLPDQESHTILEFASGYGCVTRHLVKLPSLSLTACDIHSAAVDFLEKEIGARAVLSSRYPENLALPEFDVVFALSFFSHMPITTWSRWLVSLLRSVRPGGVLMFTTQGLHSRKHFGNPTINEMGFWFRFESEQADLSTAEYGQTIVTPEFCKANIASIDRTHLLDAKEAFWWEHQDLYVVRKL